MSKLSKTGTTSQTRPSTSKSKSGPRFSGTDYIPKRFGLKYDPPTIILEYLVPSSSKLYHHKMKLPQLKPTSNIDDLIDHLHEKHQQYLSHKRIDDDQMHTLIERLLERISGKGGKLSKPATNTSSYKPSNTFGSKQNEDPFDDFGSKKDSKPPSLGGTKPLSGGLSNNTTVGNKTSSYEPTFGTSTFKDTKKAPPVEEPEEDIYEEDFEEIDFDENDVPALRKSNLSASTSVKLDAKNSKNTTQKTNNNGWENIGEPDESVDYNTFNLNKLTPEEVARHKEKMNSTFSKNVKKPGDPGYAYDVKADFKPSQDNEWDEEL